MVEHGHQLSNGVTVRLAEEADIPGIMAVHTEVFITTYSGLSGLSEEIVREHITHPEVIERLTNEKRKQMAQDSSVVYVATLDDSVVGFGSAEIDEAGMHWNNGLYVSKQGVGVGRRLTQERLAWHGSNSDVYLSVVAGTPAIAYHEHMGFRQTGRTFDVYLISGHPLPQIEMKCSPQPQ